MSERSVFVNVSFPALQQAGCVEFQRIEHGFIPVHPFQFSFVRIIKKACAFSNKIIIICSTTNANGSATFCRLLSETGYTSLTPHGIKLLGKKLISWSTFSHPVNFSDEGAF